MRIIQLSLMGAVLGVVGLTGCATHENVAEHHHHEDKTQFDGQCAYSVSNGKYDVVGKPEYQLDHNGVKYYFSNSDAMSKFQAHITDSVNRANASWDRRGSRR